jgi:hypothetical protein
LTDTPRDGEDDDGKEIRIGQDIAEIKRERIDEDSDEGDFEDSDY